MPFTGKTSRQATGSLLPKGAEDLCGSVAALSPYETPLLDHLGDAPRPAKSAYHEWLEDAPAENNGRSGRRKGNWTEVFWAAVGADGAETLAPNVPGADELVCLKQQRLRQLLRSLESTVIRGGDASTAAESRPGGRREITGIIPSIATNVFRPGRDGFPGDLLLTADHLDDAIRRVRRRAAGRIDTIVVSGPQMSRINSALAPGRNAAARRTPYPELAGAYKNDFGACRVVLSRHVPADTVLLLDGSRIDVLPLSGWSFQYTPADPRSDARGGEIIGIYTLEFRDERAHGIITALGVSPAGTRKTPNAPERPIL